MFALAAFGIYASHDVVVKFLGANFSAFQIVFFSVLLGFPFVTLMMMRDITHGNFRPVHPWWTALRTLSTIMTAVSAFYAFSVLPLAQTYAILFSSPLMITVLAIPILGETVRMRRWAAVIVGLCGVMIVLRPGAEPLSLGHLAALIAAIGNAVSSVIVRKIGHEERSAVLLLYPMFGNFVVMGCAMPFFYLPMEGIHLAGLSVIALCAFLASLLVISAYRNGEAVIVSPMQYSQILWAAVYGWFIFGEKPDGPTILGASVIIASGLYILFREGKADASKTMPNLQGRGRVETGTFVRLNPLLRRNRQVD